MSHSNSDSEADTMSETGRKSAGGTLGVLSTLLTILLIAGGAGGMMVWIYASEPEARREGATKQTPMLVDVREIKRGTHTPQIEGLGRVEAARDIILSPRVEGRIVDVSESFMPGGFVDAGKTLVKIDPADFENTLKQRQSAFRQAKADLDIELGRRDVAKREYKLLDQELSGENKALVLREPQLRSARASVLSARAALNQAKLDLDRTEVKAPFNAQILSRTANLGSRVEAGENLARLIGIDEYWVIVTVPVAKLGRIAFPGEGENGAPVKLRNRTAWPEGTYRTGRVSRLIGALDTDTRLARIVVRVKDPLALEGGTGGPRMIVDTIMHAVIEGAPLENVARIDRDHVREDDTIWVMQDGKLAIRNAEILFRDKKYAYIRDGLEDGDMLVTSRLATVAGGAPLRTQSGDGAENAQEEAE